MEQKRQCVVAGGYIRIIAVRLIFLHYIDTRCSMSCPPTLHHRQDGNKSRIPSPKELVFGLKLLSKGGRAILRHEKSARDAHDSLSLAISCFNVLSSMAESNGEAANEMKDALLDEAFDVYSALPDAAGLFEGGQCADVSEKEDDASTQANNSTVDWPSIVQKHLDTAKTFIMDHCSDALIDEKKSTLKYIALQRFLPMLSRLCLKYGSRYMKFGLNEQAKDALNNGLTVTNSCLKYVKEERKRTKRKSENQMLENLEAQVLQISIESFYTLSSVVHSLGRKNEALRCLDQVEEYMEEKHRRDDQLHEGTMTDLGKDGEFVFSEYAIGPAQDRNDMRNRSDTAVTKGRHIHSWQKAVLSSYRIKLYNDNPSEEDERCIDRQLRSMVELVSEREDITLVGESMRENNILKLVLKTLRSVHTRRMMLYLSNVKEYGNEPEPDTYQIMFDQLSRGHQLRPSVVLDKISAILHVSSEVRRRKLDGVFHSIDQEVIILADQFLSSLKHETPSDTTLFVDTKNVMKTELINDAKEQFARAVSLYHSWDAHEMCAKWARMMKDLHEKNRVASEHGEGHLQAGVLSLLGFSLSMSGNHAEGMKMAREAWNIHKCVDNLVTLFHCATKHETADTLLEFDNALNELPVNDHDNILEHFPRLSNACVENEADGGGELLLGIQERWMNLLLRSRALSACLEEREECECDLTVLDLLSAYLENFEHVSSTQTDSQKLQNMCEYLGHIIDGVLRLLQLCRDRKPQKVPVRRKKKQKRSKESSEGDAGFDSMWDDAATQKLLGMRSQCVCVAETLWNIGNQLMITSVLDNATYDSRALAADLFAASHDFILMSEEEEGAQLSKLDYDVKYEPEKFEVPSFSGDATTTASDISSEFSAQCLLLSAAVTADHVDMSKVEHGSTKSLLRRTLHRLAASQQEFELNCKKRGKISKMIALLTMRCIIGIGEDSFAFQTCNDGLCDTLLKLHCKYVARSEEKFEILAQMKAISDLAMQKQLTHTDRVVTKLCSDMMQKSNVFEANLGGGVVLSLGDLKRKMVLQSVSVEEAIEVFQDIDDIVKKKAGLGDGEKMMFSAETFSWCSIEAHTRGVQLSMIGDDDKAKIFFSFALNFVEFSTKEVRSYKQEMMSSFTRAVQTLDFPKLYC